MRKHAICILSMCCHCVEVMQLQMAKMADEWRTEEDTPQQEAQEKSALAKRQKDKLRKTNEELHSQVHIRN